MTNTNGTKQLYISDANKRLEYTPENNYDPRYYDLSWWDEGMCCTIDEPCEPVIAELESKYGEFCYSLTCGGVIYTENADVMHELQDNWEYEPVWFDSVIGEKGVATELREEGWRW